MIPAGDATVFVKKESGVRRRWQGEASPKPSIEVNNAAGCTRPFIHSVTPELLISAPSPKKFSERSIVPPELL
jgi:hypothetical protein